MPHLETTQQARGKQKASEAWESPLSHATTLLCLFVDTYGTEGLEWHPQTMRLQVESDFGVKLPEQNWHRLLVAVLLLTTDYFYNRPAYFNEMCCVLSGDDLDPGVFKPADAMDCAWGVTEATLISPPDTEHPFTDEVRYYVGALLKDEGFIKPPQVLSMALGELGLSQVQEDYSPDTDDGGLFTAIWQTQASKSNEIDQLVRSTLESLLQQVEALPLQNGDTKGLRDRLRKDIRPNGEEKVRRT